MTEESDDIYGLIEADHAARVEEPFEGDVTQQKAETVGFEEQNGRKRLAEGDAQHKQRGGTKEAKKRRKMAQKQRDTGVFVTNLPQSMSEIEIRELASKYGFVQSMRVPRDDKGRMKGYCHFEFSTVEAAAVAVMNLQGLEVGEGSAARILLASHQGEEPPEFELPGDLIDDIRVVLQDPKVKGSNVSVLKYHLEERRGEKVYVQKYGFRGVVQALQSLPFVGIEWENLTARPYFVMGKDMGSVETAFDGGVTNVVAEKVTREDVPSVS